MNPTKQPWWSTVDVVVAPGGGLNQPQPIRVIANGAGQGIRSFVPRASELGLLMTSRLAWRISFQRPAVP